MERRTALGLFATTVGLSTGLVGSSAVSFVRADRNISLEVVDDDQAYLELVPTELYGRSGSLRYRQDGPSQIDFEIPGRGEPENTGEGVGLDSVYFFDGLLDIKNNGTSGVRISTEFPDEAVSVDDVDLFVAEDGERKRLREHPVEITSGEKIRTGLYISTAEGELGEFDLTFTIVANK